MPNPTKRKLRKLLRLKRAQATTPAPVEEVVVEEVVVEKVEVPKVRTAKVKTVNKAVKTDD